MEQWAAAFNFIKAGRLSELLLHNTTRARNMELICTWKAFPTHMEIKDSQQHCIDDQVLLNCQKE